MAEKISDTARIDKDGPHVDPLVIQMWLEQEDTKRLRRSVSLEKFIQHVYAMSEMSIQRGLSSPSHSGKLTELFFAARHALRVMSQFPNVWQFHLLKLIQKCGYDNNEIIQVVNALYTGWPEDTLEHMNIAARQLKIGTIFDLSKK